MRPGDAGAASPRKPAGSLVAAWPGGHRSAISAIALLSVNQVERQPPSVGRADGRDAGGLVEPAPAQAGELLAGLVAKLGDSLTFAVVMPSGYLPPSPFR